MDDRFAAAFTTSNQLIIIDIMLGHYIKVERPMEKMDEIVNIALSCDSPQAAASRIVDQAIYGGCEDNATALIMPFGRTWKNGVNLSFGSSQESNFGRNLTLSPRFM